MPEEADRERATREGDRPRVRIVDVPSEGRPLTVTGYGSAWCDEWTLHPTITTTVAGIVTQEWPAILRVRVYDA